MADVRSLVLAGVVALLGMLGLLTAALAEQVAIYWAGLLVFGLAIVFVFRAIKNYFDAREAQQDIDGPDAG